MTFTYQELQDELHTYTLRAFAAEDKLEKVSVYAKTLISDGSDFAAGIGTDIQYLIGENK